MSAPTPSWYDLLGVEPDASADEIRAAWKAGSPTWTRPTGASGRSTRPPRSCSTPSRARGVRRRLGVTSAARQPSRRWSRRSRSDRHETSVTDAGTQPEPAGPALGPRLAPRRPRPGGRGADRGLSSGRRRRRPPTTQVNDATDRRPGRGRAGDRGDRVLRLPQPRRRPGRGVGVHDRRVREGLRGAVRGDPRERPRDQDDPHAPTWWRPASSGPATTGSRSSCSSTTRGPTPRSPTPEVGKNQVTVTMEKVGDEWLVDDLKTTLPSS